MKRNPFWPGRVADQVTLLVKFGNKLPTHATALGLTPQQVSAGQADAAWLVYVLQAWLPAVRSWAQSCTDAATTAQTGDGAVAQTLPVFTAPDLGGAVAVLPGALTRLFDLFELIKDSDGFGEQIGTDLGILGAEQTGPDFATLAPGFKLTRTPAGIVVGWTWQGFAKFLDMIELQVDRGDGQGWRLLAYPKNPQRAYAIARAVVSRPESSDANRQRAEKTVAKARRKLEPDQMLAAEEEVAKESARLQSASGAKATAEKLGIDLKNTAAITKAQWKAELGRINPLFAISGEIQMGKNAFIKLCGEPKKTQTVGDTTYWYYECKDGVIQLSLDKVNLLTGIVTGQANDY